VLKQKLKQALRPLVAASGSPRPPLPPSLWQLEHQPGRGLCLDGLSLHELLSRWGSPLHVVHAGALAQKAAAFQEGAGDACETFYSYKTNPVPGVLRFLHARGIGAEVISPYELWLAFRLGVPADRIIYNGPAKSVESLREALTKGVRLVNANHREEMAKIAAVANEVGVRAPLGIRVAPPQGWAGQFGIPIAGGEALRAFEEALAEPAFEVKALHAHFGFPIRSEAQLADLTGAVLGFCDELHGRFRFEPTYLDFGGSLAIPTVADMSASERRLNRTFLRPLSPPDHTAAVAPAAYVRRLMEATAQHFRSRGRNAPRLLLEPGRALTGSTQMLLASVVETKRAADGTTFAILDAGINLAETVRYQYHQLFPVNRYGEPPAQTYRLVGPICSPGDILYDACPLPALQPGDSLAVMDAGAYFVPFSTSFSFPQPAIVMVEDGRARLLRRAETFEDLVLLDE